MRDTTRAMTMPVTSGTEATGGEPDGRARPPSSVPPLSIRGGRPTARPGRRPRPGSTPRFRQPQPFRTPRRLRPANSRRRAGGPARARAGPGSPGRRRGARRRRPCRRRPPPATRAPPAGGRARVRPLPPAPGPTPAPDRPDGERCAAAAELDEGAGDDRRGQDAVPGGQGVPVPGPGHQPEADGGGRFDQGVTDRDGLVAGVAPPAEGEPRHHGHILPPGQLPVAGGTEGPGRGDRESEGGPVHHDVQEGADQEAEERGQGDDQPLEGPVGSVHRSLADVGRP